MEQVVPRKIGGLTALRFFAAAAIVAHHMRGRFGINATFLEGYELDQAVAFFFVLSGFILTFVYPTLEGVGWKRFLLGRFARIWPGHVAATALLFILVPTSVWGPAGVFSVSTFAGNLALVQAWVPLDGQFFSYNSPAWSISTEFGFYLLFPVLVHRWERTWHVKLAGTFLLAAGMVAAAAYLLPEIGGGRISPSDLVYTHPLARLFEFTLGMAAALIWRRAAPKVRLGRLSGTCVEIAALALVAWSVSMSSLWSQAAHASGGIGPALGLWLVHGGFSCVPFAILVMVVASQAGAISRLLDIPILVLLGEISYSIYLVHQCIVGLRSNVPEPVGCSGVC